MQTLKNTVAHEFVHEWSIVSSSQYGSRHEHKWEPQHAAHSTKILRTIYVYPLSFVPSNTQALIYVINHNRLLELQYSYIDGGEWLNSWNPYTYFMHHTYMYVELEELIQGTVIKTRQERSEPRRDQHKRNSKWIVWMNTHVLILHIMQQLTSKVTFTQAHFTYTWFIKRIEFHYYSHT